MLIFIASSKPSQSLVASTLILYAYLQFGQGSPRTAHLCYSGISWCPKGWAGVTEGLQSPARCAQTCPGSDETPTQPKPPHSMCLGPKRGRRSWAPFFTKLGMYSLFCPLHSFHEKPVAKSSLDPICICSVHIGQSYCRDSSKVLLREVRYTPEITLQVAAKEFLKEHITF